MYYVIILLCDLQLRTKKFYHHIHIVHFITRDFTHHELTQDKIDCRIFYCIAVPKSLQPCLHLLYRMDILETFGTSDFVESPSGSPPSMAPSLDYCRLPSHLGKSSELICTRFGVSYLDILDFCFLEYYNVILSFSILFGGRLLS